MVSAYVAARFQRAGVVEHHLLAVFGRNAELRGQRRVEAPAPGLQVSGVNIGVGCGVAAFGIHEEERGKICCARCVSIVAEMCVMWLMLR